MARHAHRFLLALTLICTQALAAPTPEHVRKDAREIFKTIIGFRTSEGLGQTPTMAKYLADRFRQAGFAESDVHILPVGETASLVVRYRGDGRGGKPILLLAHMDVVTAKPEEWERDPFTLIEENGFFYGRGVIDNKQGVAVAHHDVSAIEERRIRPFPRSDHRLQRR